MSSGTMISAGRKDGANLGVEGVEDGRGEGLGHGALVSARLVLLGLNEDEDGDMMGMRVRPGADLFEALGEGLADAAVVDVLHVHDFEAGFFHDAVGIEVGVRRQAGLGDHLRAERVSVEAAFGVGIDVKLDLADAGIKLRG